MKIAAVLMIVLALVIGIAPQFSDCHSQGNMLTLANGRQIDMKCHWTAQGEIALALPLLAVGGMSLTTRRRETLQKLSILGFILGVLVILLPTALIGVCASPEMMCNAVMRPTLILSGTLVSALSLAGFFASRRIPEDAVEPIQLVG